MQQNENWRPIPSYEGFYEINEQGLVRSLHKNNYGHIMPQRIDRAGYYTVRLSKKGKDSTQYVHRLLGFAFITIPDLDKKDRINHKDCNKLNNRLDNLEWVSHSENMQHAYNHRQIEKKGKSVIDILSGVVYKNIHEASLKVGIVYSTLKNYLNGNRPNPTSLRYF